jgi:hypothetical protein
MCSAVLRYLQDRDTFYLFKKDILFIGNDLGLSVSVSTRRVLQYCTVAHSITQAKGLTNLA